MTDRQTDFFEYVDNFKSISHIHSLPIISSSLDFIPKVTIAIPTFKRANLLKVALDSALNQKKYNCYDVIVVDNNSERNDETECLLLSYKDSKLSYFKNLENTGMAGNWNKLFLLAKGDWVVMLHDDDILLPLFLFECMSILTKHSDIGLLKASSFKWWDNQLEKVPLIDKTSDTLCLRRLYYSSNYFGYVLGPPSGCVFNKQKVYDLGGFNDSYNPSIDYYFVVLFSKFHKVYIYDKTLSVYRYSVNESRKEHVINAFIKQDCNMMDKILTDCYVPLYFRRKLIRYRVKKWIRDYAVCLNSSFCYDGDVVYKISYFQGQFFLYLIGVYVRILRILRFKY